MRTKTLETLLKLFNPIFRFSNMTFDRNTGTFSGLGGEDGFQMDELSSEKGIYMIPFNEELIEQYKKYRTNDEGKQNIVYFNPFLKYEHALVLLNLVLRSHRLLICDDDDISLDQDDKKISIKKKFRVEELEDNIKIKKVSIEIDIYDNNGEIVDKFMSVESLSQYQIIPVYSIIFDVLMKNREYFVDNKDKKFKDKNIFLNYLNKLFEKYRRDKELDSRDNKKNKNEHPNDIDFDISNNDQQLFEHDF